MLRLPVALVVALASAVVACADPNAIPATATPAPVAPAPVAAAPPEVVEIYRAKCGSCHVRVEPGTRARGALTAALLKHRNRVHLSEPAWEALIDYLAAPG